MADMGVVESDDKRAEFRQSQPQRHLPPEHAALRRRISRADVRCFAQAFAGDHKHGPCALGAGAMQESEQRRMGLALRHAVQIEARVDGFTAARDALL